jgi:hypothetical protein
MIKASALVAVAVVGALSIVISSPTLAKTQAKVKRPHAVSSSYQSTSDHGRPAPMVRRCRHGVWDPYGLRCDILE